MAEPSKAVFLSYASQDAQAAKRICEALRSAGIEVWFDQSELRGGDVWDRNIRHQIRDCALFVPIISINSQTRLEGYFRREWKLAADRTADMAEEKPFLVPVVIDGTTERSAAVPDKFKDVQWTHLPGGETPPAFVERVARLLSPDQYVSPTPAEAAPGAAPASKHQASKSSALSRPRSVLVLVAAVAVMGIGYFAVDRFALSRRVAETVKASAPTAQPEAPSAIPEKSIAVLPFVDMSEKKDQEYFSDGLTEELLDLLAKMPDLRVPARTSSFFFKGKQEEIATIAHKLRVAHVLEGSVRKSGRTIRVTAELIRADTGYHLWSETYDRDVKDVFKVQDEIAGAVVAALKLKLAPTPQTSTVRTSNPEAHNEYLLGRQLFDRRKLDDYRRAVDAFHKAIALDPNYAAAYAGLAYSEDYLADATGNAAGLKRAEAAADKAVALAPEQADGYAARGFLRFSYARDWAGAQADFEKALTLDPNNSTVQRRHGQLLAALGRLPEAVASTRRATDLDPLSAPAWQNLGQSMIISRDFPAAHEAYRRALEIQRDDVYALTDVGVLLLFEGKAKEALTTFRKVEQESLRLLGIAMAQHTLGHVEESQQALDESIAKHAASSAYQIAEAYAWRGDKDKAFEWLERAYRQRDGGLSNVKVDPTIENLRRDPRFKAFLRKMNLPE